MSEQISAPDNTASGVPKASSSVRHRLVILVLLVLLPTTCISVIAAYTIYFAERRAMVTAAAETALALSLVVDRELAYRAGVLKTLAASPALASTDLQAFYDQARVVAQETDSAIMLSALDGQQVLNTRLPLAEPSLPKAALFNEPNANDLDGWPRLSNVFMAPVARTYSFAAGIPVSREGQTMVLSMASPATKLQEIFVKQPLPPGWTGTLVDAQGGIAARNINAEKLVGGSASPNMRALMASAPDGQGVRETTTLDGTPVITAFTRAPDSGWSVVIAVPRETMRKAALNALAAMIAAWALLSVIGAVIARRVGRSIAEPVARLQSDAERMGRGEVVEEASTGLIETDVVQRGMSQASRELRAAEALLQTKVLEAVAESERVQRAALSAQKLEALGRLTGGIAHDFNNLLQTMTTGIHLASTLAGDDRARKALAACERAVARAVTLTRQLMTFGSSQPGQLETVALQRRLGGLEELLRGALRESIDLRVDVAADTWPVRVDPVLLELAILNLALNAKDAIAGHGRVEVVAHNRVVVEDEVAGLVAGDYVSISVEDSGHGIPAALLARVFEPFFTTKPVGKGAGLGLAQVYGFARQMGGIATVHSREREGTQVSLLLPRLRAEAPAAEPVPPTFDEIRHHGTVLLVEDDSLVRGLSADSLQALGFTLLVAGSADDALAIVRSRHDIGAVLSDIVMPGGKSGLDLKAELERLRPALPVLLASGYSDALSPDVAATVIAKPYDVREVARRLSQAMAR
jgi:signal transduction histidine kinase